MCQLFTRVEEFGTHKAVMSGGMVLRVIVGKIVRAGPPVDQELSLEGSVLDPIETHIDRLGSFLFNGFVRESLGSGVVYLYGGWWLRMTHFFESCPNWNGLLSVHEG